MKKTALALGRCGLFMVAVEKRRSF